MGLYFSLSPHLILLLIHWNHRLGQAMTPEIRTSIYIDHSYLAPKVIVSHGQPQTQTEWNTTPI